MRHYHGRRGGGRLRLGYRHTVLVPSSTDRSIVFPVNRETGKFDTSCYDPAMTGGSIPREEVTAFLQEIEPHIKQIFNSPVLSFLKGYQKAHPWIIMCIFIAWVITIIVSIRSEGGFRLFFVLPGIFVAFFIFICIVLVINCWACRDIKRLIGESKMKIMPYLDARNPEFKRRGYFWVAPNSFPYWLELWKEGPGGGPMGGMSMQQQYGINMVQDLTYASNRPMYPGSVQPIYNAAPGQQGMYYGGSNLQSPAGYNGSGFMQQSPIYSGAGDQATSNFISPHLLA